MEDVAIGKIYDFRKDPEEFSIPAHDHKGELRRAYFRAPGTWLTAVSEILAKRYFPYRTPSHLYRHALWRHLKWLKDKDGRLKDTVDWLEMFMNIVKNSELRRKHGDMIAYLDREVDALQRAGAHSDARKMVYEEMNLIAESGPSDYWKRKAMRHIRNKHAELLKKGASLDPGKFEKED